MATESKSVSVDVKKWRARLARAEARQKTYHGWWEAALEAYAPAATDNAAKYATEIRTNRVFTLVERKSAELFYQQPEVQVSPSPLLDTIPEGSAIAASHGAILNEKLGLDGVNVRRNVAKPAIFDYLMFGGGWTKLGYRAYTQEVPIATADPITGEAGVDVQPVVVKGECFWESVSPKQVLIPADYTSTDFDKAPWLGYKFELSLVEARRVYGDAIPEDFTGGERDDDLRFDHGDEGGGTQPSAPDVVSAVEIWYRTSVFDPDTVHPDHLTQLVLIDGLDQPVVHKPSPYQSFDAQGRLAPDALVGYPLHPLVIRTLTDAAYVMSDVAVALPLTRELDKFREQMIRQRDSNLLHWEYNTDLIGKDDIDKLTVAPQGGMIGVAGDAYTQGWIRPLPHGPYPRENFEYNNYIDNDLQRTHALDNGSAGNMSESGLTATEANIRQANTNVRLGWEQGFVADWFMAGVTKFSTLLQRFLSIDDAIAIVGAERAQLWDGWRRQTPTKLSFSMAPDSSLRNDTPLERKQLQELYTYMANDPSVNRAYLNKKLLHKYHLDPSLALLPPAQVPQPKPAPPAMALSFKGEDLNPLSPQSPIVLDILSKMGVQIDPMAIQNAMQLGALAMAQQQVMAEQDRAAKVAAGGHEQPKHGGKVPQMESLDKHAAAETGGMQGTGAMNPGMGGGLA